MVYIASLSEHVQIYTKLMQINAMVFINCNSCSHLNVLSKILPKAFKYTWPNFHSAYLNSMTFAL